MEEQVPQVPQGPGPKPIFDINQLLNTGYKPGVVYAPGATTYSGRGRATVSASDKYDEGYIPGYENQDDRRAKNQGGIDLAVNALGRFATTTLTKAGAGAADALGFILTAGQVDSTNNIISQGFRNIEEHLKEGMPIYKSDQFKEGSFWDKIKTGEWWADNAVDGAAFMASAFITGGGAAKGVSALAKGSKFLSGIAEAEGLLGAGADLITPMTKGQKLVNNIAKSSQALGIESLGSSSMRLGVTGINTLGESMAEGYDAYTSLKNDLTAKAILGQSGNKQYEKYAKLTDEQIESASKNAYSSVFANNMMALAFSNYIEAGWILGPSGKAAGGLRSEFIKAMDEAGGDAAKGAQKFLSTSAPWLKAGKEAGIGIISEGYWEENIQSAIQKYEQAIFDPTLTPKEKSMIPGIGTNFVNNAWNGTAAMLGLANDKESKDAAESIFLGGLLGSMGGGFSAIREHSQDKADRDQTVNGWWKTYQELEAIRQSGFTRELAAPLSPEKRKVMVKTDKKKTDTTGKELDEFEEKEVELESILDETTGLYRWNQEKVIQDIRESMFNDRTVDHAILADMMNNKHYSALHGHYSLFNLAGQIERSGSLDAQDKDLMAKRIIEQYKKDRTQGKESEGENVADTGNTGNKSTTLFEDPVINLQVLNEYRKIQKEAFAQGLGDQVKLSTTFTDKEEQKQFDIFLSTLKQNYAVETFRAKAFRSLKDNFTDKPEIQDQLEELAKQKDVSAEEFNVANNPGKTKKMFSEFKKFIDFSEEEAAITQAEKDIADNPNDQDLVKAKEIDIARNRRFVSQKKLKYGYTQAPLFYSPKNKENEAKGIKSMEMAATFSGMKANRFRESFDIDARINTIAKSTLDASEFIDALNDSNENKIFDVLLSRAQVTAEKETNDPRLQALYTAKLIDKDITALRSAAYFDDSFAQKLYAKAKKITDQLETDNKSLDAAETAIFGVRDGQELVWEGTDSLLGQARRYWGTDPQEAYALAEEEFSEWGDEISNGIFRSFEDFVGFPTPELAQLMSEYFNVAENQKEKLRFFQIKEGLDPHEAYKEFLYHANIMWMDYLTSNADFLLENLDGWSEADITALLTEAQKYYNHLSTFDELNDNIDKQEKYSAVASAVVQAIDLSNKYNKKLGISSKDNITRYNPTDPDALAEEFFIESLLLSGNGVNALAIAEQIAADKGRWEEYGKKIKQGEQFEDDISLALSKLKKLKRSFDTTKGDRNIDNYTLENGKLKLEDAIKLLTIVEKYIETMTKNTIDTVNAVEANKKKLNQGVSDTLGLGTIDSSYELYDILSNLTDKKSLLTQTQLAIDGLYDGIVGDVESLMDNGAKSSIVTAIKSKDNRPDPHMIISIVLSNIQSKVWQAKAKSAKARGEKGIGPLPGSMSESVDSIMHLDNFIRTWHRTYNIDLVIKEMRKDKDMQSHPELMDKIEKIMKASEKLGAMRTAEKVLSINWDIKKVHGIIADMPKLLNGIYPNYQQINAFIEGIIELEYARQVDKKGTKVGLMGGSGSGKTMMSRFIFDYMSQYGVDKIYMVGHIKESAINLRNNINKGFADKNTLTNQELYDALIDPNHPIHQAEFIIADEQLTLPNNEMKHLYANNGIKASFLFIGDAAQPRGEAYSYLSEFDTGRVENGFHRVNVVQPLSIGYRTYIPAIESVASVYKDKSSNVIPLNVYSNINFTQLTESKEEANGVVMAKGDVTTNIINAIQQRRGDNRTRVVIVNNKTMKDKYAAITAVPGVEILTYAEVQGRTFDEAYIDIDPNQNIDIRSFSTESGKPIVGYTVASFKGLRQDFYNSIMYMTITRAKNFTYIHNYTTENVENHAGSLSDQTMMSEKEREANKTNFSNVLTSFKIEETKPTAEKPAEPTEPVTEVKEEAKETPKEGPKASTIPIPTQPDVVVSDAADDIEVNQQPDSVESTDINSAVSAIEPSTQPGNSEMLSYPSRLGNTRLFTENGSVILKLNESEVTTSDEAWVDMNDKANTFIVPMYSNPKMNGQTPDTFILAVPVKRLFNGVMTTIGFTVAAVLKPEEVQGYSDLNFLDKNDRFSRGFLNYSKGRIISTEVLKLANSHPNAFAIEIDSFNDLSITYNYKESYKNSGKLSDTYESWLDQYIINFLSELTSNEVDSTNKAALLNFINNDLVETVKGKRRVKPAHFKRGIERAQNGQFAIIFEVATSALYNGDKQKGEHKLFDEGSEMAHLIDTKGINGSPLIIFKNVPISKNEKTKADFFGVLAPPRLSKDSKSVRAIASYQQNVQSVSAALNWRNAYHTAHLTALAYAAKNMFYIENDQVKKLGFSKQELKAAIDESLRESLVSMTNKQKFMLSKSSKQEFIDERTKVSLDKMHQELEDKMKDTKERIDAMSEEEFKSFIEVLQNMSYGTEGSLFGLSEKNMTYSYSNMKALGLELRFNKKDRKLIFQSKEAQSDALDENVGETEYYTSKALSKKQFDALSSGEDILGIVGIDAILDDVVFEKTFAKKFEGTVKKEKTKFLDPYVSPIFSQIQYFAANNTEIEINGQKVNIGGTKPSIKSKSKSANQTLLHAVNPIDNQPNFSNLQRLIRSALFNRIVKYQTKAQFVFNEKGEADFNIDNFGPMFLFKNEEEANQAVKDLATQKLSHTEQKAVARFIWSIFPETSKGLEDFLSIYGEQGEYPNDDIALMMNDKGYMNKYAQPFNDDIINEITNNPEKYHDNVYINTSILKSNPQATSTKQINEQVSKEETLQAGIDSIKNVDAPVPQIKQNTITIKRSSSKRESINEPVSTSSDEIGIQSETQEFIQQPIQQPNIDETTIDVPLPSVKTSFAEFLPTTSLTSWEGINENEQFKQAVVSRFSLLLKDEEGESVGDDIIESIVTKIATNQDFSAEEQIHVDQLRAIIQDGRDERKGEPLVSTWVKAKIKPIIAYYDNSNDYTTSKTTLEEGKAYVTSVLKGMGLPEMSIQIINRLADQSILDPNLQSNVQNGAITLYIEKANEENVLYKDIFHHEFLHLILRYAMTENQRKRAFLAAKRHYEKTESTSFDKLSRDRQEEYIANTFEAWMKGKNLSSEPQGFLRKLYYAWLRVLDYFRSPNLDRTFGYIKEGVYNIYQREFDMLAESSGNEKANYDHKLKNPLYEAFNADELLTVTDAVKSKLNNYIYHGYLLNPADPNSRITLSIHQIQRLVFTEMRVHELDVVKQAFNRPNADKIYNAIIESFAKNSSKLSLIGSEAKPAKGKDKNVNENQTYEEDIFNVEDSTLANELANSEEFDVLDSPTSRFYELTLQFVKYDEQKNKVTSIQKERVKEILSDLNERMPFGNFDILSDRISSVSQLKDLTGTVAAKVHEWVNWVNQDIDEANGEIFYHFVEGKGNIILYADSSFSGRTVEQIYEAYKNKEAGVLGKYITEMWDPNDIYIYIRDNAFNGSLPSSVFSKLYNKALALNYLKTLSFTVGSLKENHFTMDIEDMFNGITSFRRRELDRNDSFASILNRLPDILLNEWQKIILDKDEKIENFKEKKKRTELKDRLVAALVDKAEKFIDKSIKDSKKVDNEFYIITDRLIQDAEFLKLAQIKNEDQEYLLGYEDEEVSEALRKISDYYQTKDKATMNHSVVSATGKKLYKFTTSSFLDNVLRTLSRKELNSSQRAEIFPYFKEEWLKHNHFVNDTDRLSRSPINMQTTHDGFKFVYTGNSKPAERENTMEYFRRLVTFSFMSTILTNSEDGKYYYDQETYQLAHRSRAQSIRTRFLNKEDAREAIVNIFKTIKERPNQSIEDFFKVAGRITNPLGKTEEEKKANSEKKLFMNLSFMNNDNKLLSDNKHVIMSGTPAEMRELADKVINHLFEQEARNLAENMMLYETPVHADILSVMEIMKGMGYVTQAEVNDFSNIIPSTHERAGKKFLNKKTEKEDKTKEYWFNVLTEPQKEIALKGLAKILGGYITNRYANMWHLSNVIAGDMLMYSDVTNLVKRNLGASATGQRLFVSNKYGASENTHALVIKDPLLQIKEMSDADRLASFKRDFAKNDAFKDMDYNQALAALQATRDLPQAEGQSSEDYLETQEYVSRAINMLTSGYETSMEAFLYKILDTKYTGEELKAKVDEILKGFGKNIETTDGQGLMSYEGYLNMRKGLDDSFGLAGTIKMVYFGISDHGNTAAIPELANKSTPFYAKNSYLVLTPDLMERFPELRQMSDFMKSQSKDGKEIHEILFDSNVKVGAPRNIVSSQDVLSYQMGHINNSEDNNNLETFNNTIASSTVKLNNNFRRVQFNPKSKLESKIALPTQLLYMIGTMTPDNARVRLAYTSLSYLFEKEMHNILYGKVRNDFSNYILDMLGKSPEAYFYYDLMTGERTVDKTILNDPYVKKKFITSLISGTTKDAINIRFRGAKMVLVSSDVISNRQGPSIEDESREWRAKYADRLTYKKEIDSDGVERIFADVVVPRGLFDHNPKMLESIKKNGLYFTSGDLLSFRIPTTGKHSGIVFRVVDVHDSGDNIIFAPAESAGIMGSDLDIDGLFTIQRGIWEGDNVGIMYDIKGREYSVNAISGNPIGYVGDLDEEGNPDILTMHEALVERQLESISVIKKHLKESIKLGKDGTGRSVTKDSLKDMKKEIRDLNKIEDTLLRNVLIEQIVNTLTDKDHWDEMISPITMEFVGPIIKKIRNAGYQQETDQTFNLSLPQDAARMHYNVFAGLNLVGVNANAFKSYAYIFRAGLSESAKSAITEQFKLLRTKIIDDKAGKLEDINKIEDPELKKATREVRDKLQAKIMGTSEDRLHQYVISSADNLKKYATELSRIQEIINSQVMGDTAQIPHTETTETVEGYKDTPMSTLRTKSLGLGKLDSFNIDDTNYKGLSEFSYVNSKYGDKRPIVKGSSWLTLDTFINLAVDNVKEGILAQLRLDFDTINANVAMIMLGMPFTGIFNYQPVIGLLKWGKYATIDKLNLRVGLSSIGGRPVVKTTGLDKIDNKKLSIGDLLYKTLLYIDPAAIGETITETEKDEEGKTASDKKVSYAYLDDYLSHDNVKLSDASLSLNMTKEKNLAVQALFSKLMKYNNLDIVQPKVLLDTYNSMLSDETKVDMDQFIYDLKHNLKVLLYFKSLNKIGDDMKAVNNTINTIRMNATDITGIDTTLKEVKKIGNVSLGLVYQPDNSFLDYKEEIDQNKYFIFNDSFAFDVTNFFNINPQLRSSVNLLEEINKIMKDKKISPWTSGFTRGTIDTAWKEVTGSKDFSKIFKYRFNGFVNNDAAKYLMMDEMQRYALFYFWEKLGDVKANDFDIKQVSQYTKDFIAVAKKGELGKNELIASLRYEDDYLRFNRKRDVDATESFAIYKTAVNELLDKSYDINTKKIIELELDEDGDYIDLEDTQNIIPITHLLALASKFSKTASSEAEDSVYRVLDFESKDYVNRLFQAAFVQMEKEYGYWSARIIATEDTSGKSSSDQMNAFNKGFVTSFLRRNIVYLNQLRDSLDGDIKLFDTGNTYTTDKGKSRTDYSGHEMVNGKLLFYDLKVTAKNDTIPPQFASMSFNLYQRTGEVVVNSDGSKQYYYVGLGGSKLFSNNDSMANLSKYGLNKLRVISSIKEEGEGENKRTYITTAKDLLEMSKDSEHKIVVYNKSDTEFANPLIFKIDETNVKSSAAKQKSNFDKLNQRDYALLNEYNPVLFDVPADIIIDETIALEAEIETEYEIMEDICDLTRNK